MNLSARYVLGMMLAKLLLTCRCAERAMGKVLRGEQILSVYFHNPSQSQFVACIKWLKSHGLQFISTQTLESILKEGQPLPKGAVVLTVDDGWQCNRANIVDVAQTYHVPVTIFVSTEPVEDGVYWWSYVREAEKLKVSTDSIEALKHLPNYERLIRLNILKKKVKLSREALTIEQVQSISKSPYITIGGHTHSHPILTMCSNKELLLEITESKRKLEQWTGKEVTSFAYPNGDYGTREIQAVKQSGYTLAFCTEPRGVLSTGGSGMYTIPRFGFSEKASFAENICRITGIWQPLFYRLKGRPQRRRIEVSQQMQTIITPAQLPHMNTPTG